MDADAVELRVLGCLLEKQRTTPDQYPLTLNALRNACNQTTNRDPVVVYDEGEIHEARATALDPADLPATLATLEAVAVEDGRDEIGWQVPQLAGPAVRHLLGRRYRMDPMPVFLMTDGPALPGAFDRYILTSPPFFV